MSQLPAPSPIETVTFAGLSDRQSAFVHAYVTLGGQRGAAASAAQTAGYSPENRAAARVRASELLRNPKVLAVLRDELTRKLNVAATLGIEVLIELALDAPPQVRLAAAKELLDRGYGPVVSRNAHIHSGVTIEELLSKLDEESASYDSTNGRLVTS